MNFFSSLIWARSGCVASTTNSSGSGSGASAGFWMTTPFLVLHTTCPRTITSTSVACASRFLRSQGVGTMDWPVKGGGSSGSGGGAQAGGPPCPSLPGVPTPLRGETSGVLYKEWAMALVCSPEASIPGSTRSSSGDNWVGRTGIPSKSSARASSSSYSTVGWLRQGSGRVHMAQRPSRAHLVRISRVPSEISRNLAASTTSRKAAPSARAEVNTASWST
mmetsp:Transcript_52550/g.119711  ORF Transcript_52550/g.119711 Transcript_52550/m.119711 type:complete len:220 (-) Transcript_52550:802-1461(-)